MRALQYGLDNGHDAAEVMVDASISEHGMVRLPQQAGSLVSSPLNLRSWTYDEADM